MHTRYTDKKLHGFILRLSNGMNIGKSKNSKPPNLRFISDLGFHKRTWKTEGGCKERDADKNQKIKSYGTKNKITGQAMVLELPKIHKIIQV